mgnify:FL=1
MEKHSKMKRIRLNDSEAIKLGFQIKNNKGQGNPKYYLTAEEIIEIEKIRGLKVEVKSKSKSNEYKPKKEFVLSAWNSKGHMMDIEEYCIHYNLPRNDISSYKLVSHTGTPFYNIVFKENTIEIAKEEIDFDSIVSKYIKPIKVDVESKFNLFDFDSLTYSDVHIGMDTNSKGNSMYATLWNAEEVMKASNEIVIKVLQNQQSDVLIVDELGDLLDGYNGKTTRGGHDLPQNMTNEEVFDCGLKFKMNILDRLINHYKEIRFNNICNDNHAGSFGYFVNSAFKSLAEQKYSNVTVDNYRDFISHYFVNDVCFVITHGKDDSTLKFGFKPHLDPKQTEKIDQYLKRNSIYSKAKKIIFKKGDSHQMLFDMAGSDDFYYCNYPALSPSSQWVQNNFKKGRRGFVLESFYGIENTIKPFFL